MMKSNLLATLLKRMMLAVTILVLGSAASWAQSIFDNPITGTNPNTANPYTAGQTVNGNITVSGIGRGSGITSANANNRYTATGWNSASLDANDYFEFTLTPNSGFKINFVSFVYTAQLSGGTMSHAFRSSLDGFTANIGTPTTTGATISLSAGTYQNITGPITFRLYGWLADAGTRTFSVNDFTFNGTVVPTVTTYTVTYNGNGSTGGTAPIDGSSPYNSGSSVTVLGNTGSLVKSGSIFAGWNTAANGSGTPYSPGNPFTISANTTLYAQWTPVYTVTYSGNGNTGGTAPVDGSSPYLSGATVTVLANTGTLTKTGYTFAGWNTAADGSGTDYAATGSATFTIGAANVILYAKWTINTYTVTYDGNTSDGGTAPVDGSSPYNFGSTVTVLGVGSLTKSGNAFAGWNTAADGSGTSYSPGSTFSVAANTTLFAQWTASPTITISGTLSAVDTIYGTASPTPSSFTVSGIFLTGDLTVAPPSGFEVSLSSGSGYTTSLTVPASGTLASTQIYVRLAATTAFGSYSGNVTVSGGGASSQTIATASSSVAKKGLTITGVTGTTQVYNQTTAANLIGTPAYVGLENGDTPSVTGTPAGTFATASVGTGKAITVTGYTAPTANYSVTQPTGLTGDVTPLALTVTGAAVTTKVYDGTDAAVITGTLVGVIPGDTVTLVGTGTFDSVDVGAGIAVISTSTLSGAQAGNYSITQPTGLTGIISQAPQTITFAALADKLTTDAPFALTATGGASGQPVTYVSSTPAVATVSGNLVTIVGAGTTTITASQAGTANYSAATDVARTLTVVAPSPHLVVVRIGDGTQTLIANGNTVFLDQYSASGTLVQSVTIPDSGSTPLILTPVTTSDGALSRSPDGKVLSLAGYKVARLSSSSQPSTASSATVPRAGVTVDGAGNIVMPVQTTLFSGTSIRSVATDANGNYWASGGNSGTAYLGTGTPAVIQSATANTRVNAIINGNLYYSTGAGTVGIYQFSGTPTTATAPTLLFGIASGSPYGFSINPSGTVAYVADDRTSSAGGILRYNFVSGSWLFAYTLGTGAANIGARGLAVDWSGANPVIYATTAEGSANRLIKITDTGSGSVASTLATAGANKIFRGVAFAPVPAITTQPIDTTVASGVTATFTAAASATPSPTAQWQLSTDGGTVWSDILGETSTTTYSFLNPVVADTGKKFRVVYNNLNGSVTSSVVTLTVIKATPSITTAPTASSILFGQALSASTLSGGVASTAGTFAYTAPATVPAVGGEAAQSVTFTPTDTANFNTVTLNVNVRVNPAPGAISLTTTTNRLANLWTNKLILIAGYAGVNLSITGVTSPTTNGGTAVIDGTNIVYTPALDSTSADAITYTLSDDAGGSSVGTVTVTVTLPNVGNASTITDLEVVPPNVILTASGAPNTTYKILISDDGGSTWSSYASPYGSTNTAPNGILKFIDTTPNGTSRFYRLAQ